MTRGSTRGWLHEGPQSFRWTERRSGLHPATPHARVFRKCCERSIGDAAGSAKENDGSRGRRDVRPVECPGAGPGDSASKTTCPCPQGALSAGRRAEQGHGTPWIHAMCIGPVSAPMKSRSADDLCHTQKGRCRQKANRGSGMSKDVIGDRLFARAGPDDERTIRRDQSPSDLGENRGGNPLVGLKTAATRVEKDERIPWCDAQQGQGAVRLGAMLHCDGKRRGPRPGELVDPERAQEREVAAQPMHRMGW